jgi:thiosulfate dehydrogenase [quinone] large subunit
MAFDRQSAGLTTLRIFIGAFFLFEGLSKVRWFVNGSLLGGQLAGWARAVAPGSLSARYLQAIAIPHAALFARLVPLGEISTGLAMLLGLWTPWAALLALFMALNFHIAAGTIFRASFLINGYGLPVFGATLALVLGGVRLPWSLRL